MNLTVDGKSYDPVRFEIDEARVRAFQDLFGGADVVPPTILTAAEFAVFPEVIGDPELALDFTRVVHASQEYEYRRALRVGEVLSVRARVASIREKGGNGFLTIETTMTDADGSVVATARSTMVERRTG